MENKNKNTFVRGNFSFNLAADLPTKTEFVKAYAGNLNSDINSLYDDLKKAHSAFNKPLKKKVDSEKEDK